MKNINILNTVLITISLIYFGILTCLENDIKEELKKILLKQKIMIYVFVLSTILLFVLEVVNAEKIKQIMAFVQLLYMFYAIFIIFLIISVMKNRNEIVLNTMKLFIHLGLYFSVLSILIELMPNHIVQEANKFYMQTNFILGVSLRQEVMGVGLSRRYSSIFSNPNNFGFYMFLTLVLFFYSYRKTEFKIDYKVIFLLLLSGLIRSGSRNSIVSLFLFVFIYIIINIKKMEKKKILKMNLSIIIFVTLSIVITATLLYLSRGFNSSSGRLALWKKGLQLVKVHMLEGIGTYKTREMTRNMGFSHFHNSYIQLLVSGGLIYLTCYIFFIALIFKGLWTNKGRKNTVFLISFLFALIFYQVFESTVLIIHPYMVIFAYYLVHLFNSEKEVIKI